MSLTPFAQKWVAALRSGKYKQGGGCLRQELEDGYRHCCLGVACEVAIEEGLIESYDGDKPLLDARPEVQNALALATPRGSYDGPKGSYDGGCLTEANDQRTSFAEIADIIESEPKGLFRAAGGVAA